MIPRGGGPALHDLTYVIEVSRERESRKDFKM